MIVRHFLSCILDLSFFGLQHSIIGSWLERHPGTRKTYPPAQIIHPDTSESDIQHVPFSDAPTLQTRTWSSAETYLNPPDIPSRSSGLNPVSRLIYKTPVSPWVHPLTHPLLRSRHSLLIDMQFRAFVLAFTTLFFFFDLSYARTRVRSTLDTKRSSKRTPTPTTSDALTSRQYHVPRALLDVCVYLDTGALAHLNVLGIPIGTLLDLDVCLCASALPVLLSTNVELKVLAKLLGTTALEAELKLLVSI